MAIVAGVDFGTLSVRVSILDTGRGRLGSAVEEYPLQRKRDDPDYATQAHADQMRALAAAMREAVSAAGIGGEQVEAIALDTTGSSVIPVDAEMQPLDDYYLWCDHRAKKEAQQITELAHAEKLEAIDWCGGVYSHEWGFAKLLHWLRHNPEKRGHFASAFEHCDMVAATLCGIRDPKKVKRSVCAMGHKWMWNPKWGGLPAQEFLSKLDPLFDGIREKLDGDYRTSNAIAGHLCAQWADELGLRAGIPIPVGAFDAHWDALGAGCREGDVVNVVGTSTCIVAMARKTELVPGVCGVVPGSVHPQYTGIEAGLSATGDIFEAIARRAGMKVAELSKGLEGYARGADGIAAHELGQWRPDGAGESGAGRSDAGLEPGAHGAGRAVCGHRGHGIPHAHHPGAHGGTRRAGGSRDQRRRHSAEQPGAEPGVRQRAEQAGAGALGHADEPGFGDIRGAGGGRIQDRGGGAGSAMCLGHTTIDPDPQSAAVYEQLYPLYRKLYFGLGTRTAAPIALGDVLPELRRIAERQRSEMKRI